MLELQFELKCNYQILCIFSAVHTEYFLFIELAFIKLDVTEKLIKS